MSAFFPSLLAVLLSELGDKTQLLALVLAARFAQKGRILAGIVAATLLNHLLSAWFGTQLAQWLSAQTMALAAGISFIAVGLWLLKPDKIEETDNKYLHLGAFWAAFVLFFLAEVGDKSQIATVLLATRYPDMAGVVLGSTLGMVSANAPVVFLGAALMEKLPLKAVRIGACLLFCGLGVWSLLHSGIF